MASSCLCHFCRVRWWHPLLGSSKACESQFCLCFKWFRAKINTRTSFRLAKANWGHRARAGAPKSVPHLTSPPLCLVPARLEGAPIIRQILRVVIVSFAVSYCCSPVHCVRYRIVSVLANYLGLTRSASPPPTLTPEANSVGDKVQVGLPPAPVTAGGLLWCVHPRHLLLLLGDQIGCTCSPSADPRIVFTSPPPLFLRQPTLAGLLPQLTLRLYIITSLFDPAFRSSF